MSESEILDLVAAEVLAASQLRGRRRRDRMAHLAEVHLAMTVGTARRALHALQECRAQ